MTPYKHESINKALLLPIFQILLYFEYKGSETKYENT